MVLDKIDVDRVVSPVKPVQRAAQKGTSGAFEDALEDFRRSKPAETNHSAEAEGDAVFTRLLTDGSVLVLISETHMRGANAAAQRRLLRSIAGYPHPDTSPGRASLLASRAAQGAGAVAALVNRAV